MAARVALVLSAILIARGKAQTYSATYVPSNTPSQTQDGQYGTNQCGSGSDQDSLCQNAYLNSVDDFCLFAPPYSGANATIGDTERVEVAWCLKDGYGTRLIPDGTIAGAHFVQTPDYIQITGVGDLTNLNIPAGDAGGELDPHGADGNGNPVGGLVFSNAFGQMQQLHEWTNYMSDTQFCFRACKPGPDATSYCQHIYDVMGCNWNMPGNYDAGVFDRCLGDDGEPMGVYGTSTFKQGHPPTPSAHPAPATSLCTTYSSVGNGVLQARKLNVNATIAASSTATASNATATPSITPVTSSMGTLATALPTATHITIPASASGTPSVTGVNRSYSGTSGRPDIGALWQLVVLLGTTLVGMAFCF